MPQINTGRSFQAAIEIDGWLLTDASPAGCHAHRSGWACLPPRPMAIPSKQRRRHPATCSPTRAAVPRHPVHDSCSPHPIPPTIRESPRRSSTACLRAKSASPKVSINLRCAPNLRQSDAKTAPNRAQTSHGATFSHLALNDKEPRRHCCATWARWVRPTQVKPSEQTHQNSRHLFRAGERGRIGEHAVAQRCSFRHIDLQEVHPWKIALSIAE